MESKDRELSFTEAMNSADAAKWKHACEDEIKQHLRNGTWEVVPRKNKMGSKNKARWALQGTTGGQRLPPETWQGFPRSICCSGQGHEC